MSVIEARFHGEIGALRLDAELSVPAQGVTALFGPSGAGKSTLLRLIAGLERVRDGRLIVNGETWQDGGRFVPAWRRPIGYVFQDSGLLAHLSVRGNLEFALVRAKAAARIQFDEAVDLLRLAPLLDRSVERLSGGEGRRVALARALLTQPELLLLDEPLAGLDLDARREVLARIDDLRSRLDVPMIFVSHDPAEVARVADRTLAMRSGAIVTAETARLIDEAAVREGLDGVEPDRVARLALAALRAGLDPV